MMNYAEITSRSTIVPEVLTPCIPENEAVFLAPSPVPVASCQLLAALLAHPEFQQGVRECQDPYLDFFEEAPLTEAEMIEEVETNLSRVIAETDKQSAAIFGEAPPSYLKKLGWVVGIIAKGLSYAH